MFKYGALVSERIIKHDLLLKKINGEKFSITLDEWTSMRNRRHLNINIHGIGYFWNLWLVRIRGCFSAERCSETISNRLVEYDIDFETDVVAVTTYGCSMMRKLGRLIPTLHQLCYAHGLQLDELVSILVLRKELIAIQVKPRNMMNYLRN